MSNPFDTKLEHLPTNYFSAKNIRQAFIEHGILTFDLFTFECTLQILKNMKLKKGDNRVDAFSDWHLKLIKDVLLYYHFLYQDDEDDLAEDPTQWDNGDFTKWKSRGYSLSADAYNALRAGNNTNTTS